MIWYGASTLLLASFQSFSAAGGVATTGKRPSVPVGGMVSGMVKGLLPPEATTPASQVTKVPV
ncbi:hypothetical protein D3C71_1242620 [compost metagenome]